MNKRHAGIGDIDDTEVKVIRQRLSGRFQALLADMSIDIEQGWYYGFSLGLDDPGILRINPLSFFKDLLDGVIGEKPIELVRLYVSRESLGSGVGAALMQACIREAKQRGYETLWLGVWEHNHRAQAFYRKWNFIEVGKHMFQLGDDAQTDILMQRSISE